MSSSSEKSSVIESASSDSGHRHLEAKESSPRKGAMVLGRTSSLETGRGEKELILQKKLTGNYFLNEILDHYSILCSSFHSLNELIIIDYAIAVTDRPIDF